MDTLNNLIKTSVQSVASTQQSTQGQERGRDSKTYRVDGGLYTKEELLWKRFSGLYGYAFTSQYGIDPTAEWKMVVGQVSADQIGHGINACFDKFKKFPPNPMQFLTLCLPSAVDYGLPDDGVAFGQAIGVSSCKHPSVAYTLQNMGDAVFSMRRADTDTAKGMFNAEWVKTVVYVAEGGELPEKPVEIEDGKKRKMSNDDAMAQLAAIRGDIGGPPMPEPKPEITTSIEQELADMNIIERSG